MLGLVVIEGMTPSGHLSNINEIVYEGKHLNPEHSEYCIVATY